MSEESKAMCNLSRSRASRPGFTLAELMISIGIILVLMALSTAAILRFMDLGPYSATSNNLSKIKAALDRQFQAVRDKALRDNIGSPGAAARSNHVKSKLTEAFPVQFKDIITAPSGSTSYGPYKEYLNSVGITTEPQATAVNADVQQAVCLMMILERGPQNTGMTPDVLGTSAAVPLELGNGNRAPGCVDAWGRPLRFTWTQKSDGTVTLRVVSAGPKGVFGDEDDITTDGL